MTDRTDRQGRFQDYQRGDAIQKGYRDAVADDPFDKKFMKRQFKSYDVLKKGGLHKNLKKLTRYNDVQLEALAAKAVLEKADVKKRKMNTKLNHAKYNIKWAKKVMAKRAAGQTVRRQSLKKTKAARRHILNVRRNRRLAKTPLYPNVPKGF